MIIKCDIPKGAKLIMRNGVWCPADEMSMWLIANNGGRCEAEMSLLVKNTRCCGQIINAPAVEA